jgi:pyruvate,water dikinase
MKQETPMELLAKLFRRSKPPLPGLDRRIACFREVLHANNAALGFIADIQEALEAHGPISAVDVCRMVTGVTVQTFRMVSNLMRMTGEKYRDLLPRFNDLKAILAGKVELTPALRPVGLVVPLAEVGPCLADAVGQKSAYLGEARRILKAYVPDGFTTTVEAYRAFMEVDELAARVATVLESLRDNDVAACFEASARIEQMIERCHVPDLVVRAIENAVSGLPGGPALRLAVRSSALQEGGPEMSFAGQYRSMLNIPPDGIVDAFRRVIASKYSPQAITYRLERGFKDAEVAMCCCIITMVDAVAAGVLYSSYAT